MPDDMGFDADDWLRRANQAQQSLRPPQGILAGAMPGVVDANVGGQGQGAPAGNSGAGPGLLSILNPLSEWNYQRYLANKARGEGAQAPQAMPPAAMPQAPPPQAASMPPMPPNPANPMPRVSAPQMVQPPQQPLAPQQPPVPPPQAAPGQPPQMPAIPPASPVGRTQAAQGQGNPLDQYFQQMMALQRQRMLLGMAGGLLGAPSFGQGLGRAFTNASETMAPQGDLVSRIAGAQAAGQLVGNQPGMTARDKQAAQEAVLFGGQGVLEKILNPQFQEYKSGSGRFATAPGGRRYDANTMLSTWAHEMGFQDQNGNPTKDYTQAAKKPVNGTMYYKMSDGKWRDPTELSAEQ